MVNLVFQSSDKSELVAYRNASGRIFIEITSVYGGSEWISLDTETATELAKHIKKESKQTKKED